MKTHPELVATLCKRGEDITLDPSQAHLMHMILGITGEVGELVDTIKKYIIYEQPLDKANIIEELGDLEFYLEGLRQGLGLRSCEIKDHNIKKLTKRYGEKYSNAAAKERKDKA